jgi:ribonucleoside-diphosphate reductase alpha chain
MPRESTPDDVAKAFMEGWQLGLKALAIYRDGSKEIQPLSTKTKSGQAADKAVPSPRRERLPDTRQSITHKFSISGHEGYITVGLYPDGRPGELFITMAKEGSTIGGLMDSFGTAVSMSLQYGVPLEVYVNKFSHTRFEPMGFTKNPDIRIAKSLVDYIFRWLGVTFLPGFREANKMISQADGSHPSETGEADAEPRAAATMAGGPNGAQGSSKSNGSATGNGSTANGSANGNGNGHAGAKPAAKRVVAPAVKDRLASLLLAETPSTLSRSEQFASFQADAPTCDNCGAITVRNGNCYLCHNCGSSMGCS